MEPVEVKSSAWALFSAMLSSSVGWISVQTLKETIVVAIVSTLIGYLIGKFLSWSEKKIKEKFNKKA